MRPFTRIVTIAATGTVLILASIAVPNLHNALQVSRQKRTMANVRDVGTQIEKGQKPGVVNDGWGQPLRIRRAAKHYSIRAAAADGVFETGSPRGLVNRFEDDIVLVDGSFLQMPEGI